MGAALCGEPIVGKKKRKPGTCASRKERKSRVLAPSRTGFPGRNLSELGLGVPSVWMNIRRTHGRISAAGCRPSRDRRASSIAYA